MFIDWPSLEDNVKQSHHALHWAIPDINGTPSKEDMGFPKKKRSFFQWEFPKKVKCFGDKNDLLVEALQKIWEFQKKLRFFGLGIPPKSCIFWNCTGNSQFCLTILSALGIPNKKSIKY